MIITNGWTYNMTLGYKYYKKVDRFNLLWRGLEIYIKNLEFWYYFLGLLDGALNFGALFFVTMGRKEHSNIQ